MPQVEKYQGLVARYVDTKASQEAELHVKMAALLNSKKIKLREMRVGRAVGGGRKGPWRGGAARPV